MYQGTYEEGVSYTYGNIRCLLLKRILVYEGKTENGPHQKCFVQSEVSNSGISQRTKYGVFFRNNETFWDEDR